MLTTELHDVRVQAEISEKARRAAEAEVRQASELISQLTATNSTLSVSQKKLATEHEQLTVNRHQQFMPLITSVPKAHITWLNESIL